LSNGNLDWTTSSTNYFANAVSTIAVKSGKYYVETVCQNASNSGIGFVNAASTSSITGNYGLGAPSDGWLRQHTVVNNNNSNAVTGMATLAVGDIIGLALDLDNGKAWWSKNGVFHNSGNPTNGTNATVTFTPGDKDWLIGVTLVSPSAPQSINFGQRAFAHPVSGYKSLNTANLPEPTIADGSKYFDTKLFTGAGQGNSTSVSGYSFSPDLVWTKSRAGARNHALYDIVRGNNKKLYPNTNASENSGSTITFNSTGYSLADGDDITYHGESGVGWAWDAGETTTTIAAGGLNSSVYNQSAVWSGMFSPAVSTSGQETRTFDGTIGAQGGYLNGGGSWIPTGGLTYYSTVEVYDGVDQKYAINGGTQAAIALNQWVTIASTSNSSGATLTSIDFTRISSASTTHTPAGIRIDGKLLVDQGVSVPNVPSIASTVRASASSSFSIVSYTGTGAAASIAHNLNAKPELIIVKTLDSAINWTVWHKALAATDYLTLNTTNAKGTAAAVWNSTAPTSSVIHVGTDVGTNKSGDNYIAYCFSPVEGYSAIGSYTGNGSADGPFVFTGFKPAWLMFKETTGGSDHNWFIFDSKRNTFNVLNEYLEANLAATANTHSTVDFLSNGFKFRTSNNLLGNGSGDTYIYLAFAENPFKNARAR
jgi:hypothetical protein